MTSVSPFITTTDDSSHNEAFNEYDHLLHPPTDSSDHIDFQKFSNERFMTSSSTSSWWCCWCCIPLDWIHQYEYSHDTNKNNHLSTMVLLLNSMIGSGIIIQAFVFEQSGLLGATLLYACIGWLTYTGVKLLYQLARYLHLYDYNQLTITALGDIGNEVLNYSIVFGNFGSSLSYIFIINTLTVNIIEEIIGTSNVEAMNIRIRIITSLLSIAVIVPTCLIRNFGRFAYISYLSMVAIASIIFLIVITGLFSFLFHEQHAADTVLIISGGGMLRSLGSIVFAFGYANAMFHSYDAMRKREATAVATTTEEETNIMDMFLLLLQQVTSIGIIACYITGFFGYLTFRNETQSNILENYKGFISILFKIPFIIHLLLYIPGEFVIMRYSIYQCLGWNIRRISSYIYIITTIIIISFLTIISCLLQLYASDSIILSYLLNITGAIAGSIINFIIPGLIAYRLLLPIIRMKGNIMTFYWIEFQIYTLFIFGFFLPIFTIGSIIIHLGF